ncbi:MAG: hypothetical protein IKV37_02665 [Prevotella sp.]|nr:hypothetical protein [Prevotella sp.]
MRRAQRKKHQNFSEAGAKVRTFFQPTKFFGEKMKKITKKLIFEGFFLFIQQKFLPLPLKNLKFVVSKLEEYGD